MQNERDLIAAEGMALGTLKEQALQTYQVLPQDYSIGLLNLIARIARHDLTYRDHYGAERATVTGQIKLPTSATLFCRLALTN